MLFLLWILLVGHNSPAQTQWDFSGELKFENHTYFKQLSPPTRTYDTIFKFEPQFSVKGEHDTLQFKPSLRSNPASQQGREEFFFNPKEAYWEFRAYPFRTRLGYNTYSWGIIDGFSPLDLQQSRNYINPIESEKIGSPSFEIQYESQSWNLQMVYFIRQELSTLPAIDSRWLPRSLLLNPSSGGYNFQLPENFNYYYMDHQVLDKAQEHNFVIKWSKRFTSVDFGLVHFEGISPLPQFNIYASGSLDPDVINTININSDVGLEPLFYRQRISGVQFAWTTGGVIIRLETAYTHVLSKSPYIPIWNFQSALSLERSFNIGSKTLTALLQAYYGDSDLDKDNLLSSSTRIFDESGVLGLRLALSTSTSILAGIMYDFSNQSYFINTTLNAKIMKSLNMTLRFDSIQGASDTLIGSYNKNDRMVLGLSTYW